MPTSSARKERRRKERERTSTPSAPESAPKSAYVESVEDEGECEGCKAQTHEEGRPCDDKDIPSVHPPTEYLKSQPRPARKVSALPNFSGSSAPQYKRKSNRLSAPRVPRETEPPLGSLDLCSPSIFEESLKMLDTMSHEETEQLKNLVSSQLTKENLHEHALPAGSIAGPRGVNVPLGSIPIPPGMGGRQMKPMTDEEEDALRLAVFEKLTSVEEQKSRIKSPGQTPKGSKFVNSPMLKVIDGNVDGVSQSAEFVTQETEPHSGEEASIEHSTVSNDQTGGETKMKGPDRTPSSLKGERSIRMRAAIANHVRAQARAEESEKIRKALGRARINILPPQEEEVSNIGMGHRSYSDDYTTSSSDTGARASSSRMRRITNDGILELKASPLKVDRSNASAKDHRRGVSLKLPVNVSTPQFATYPKVTQSSQFSVDEDVLTPYEAEERELEYKHRHIFIGTASLDDFLELLEVTPTHTTTKRQVIKAFGMLACGEQILARQSSTSLHGWGFVTRTTPDEILSPTDYLTESRVKLGSVTLGKFLGKIPFDDKGETDVMEVVEAFCLTSHLENDVVFGSQSKAKAIRSWMVREEAARRDH